MPSVLLVVDDEQLRATLIPLLAENGYDVACFKNATDALADDHACKSDIVLVDVTENRREESLQGAQRIRGGVDAPVILLTTAIDERVLAATFVHASGYVLKPVYGRELASAFELALFRRHAEKQAAARERWYNTTLRSIADAVITADDAARITFMNATAEQLTGWTEAEAMGQPLSDVFSVAPDTADNPATDKASGGDAAAAADAGTALRLMPRSGGSLVVEHNAAPIIEEAGALYGVVVVFRDITERRRIEQRLALSDRMASIGTLAAGIAHELNNPLAFVTSNLEFAAAELMRLRALLAKPGGAVEAASEAVDPLGDAIDALREARDGAVRAAQIVRDMKVFTRTDSDGKLLVDVNRAVQLAVRLTSNEIRHRAELLTNFADNTPPVLADEGKLVQVLVNVLTNARQALDEKHGQKITVTTGVVRGAGGGAGDDDRVFVSVKDSGRGIAPEHIGRIFEPFFTTKPVGEGLGLGLSIAHTIISGFGGTISAASAANEGATVTISLPSGDRHAKINGAKAAVRGRVLVVDDEALIGTAIRRILTKHGIEVTVEAAGRAAHDRLARGERYDVVLCDLMMPGFSGVDLWEALDEVAPDMKSRVVFMTGNAFTPRASELFENTRNVRLEKPFVPSDLTRAVTEVMSRHGTKVEL